MDQDDKNTGSDNGRALVPGGEPATKVETARIDEIQIPRRAPKRSEEVERMIAADPALGRAWERMEKNHIDFPYQEESKKEGGSTFRRAKKAVIMARRDDDGATAPLEPLEPLDTSWIYGDSAPGARRGQDVQEVEVVAREPEPPRITSSNSEPLPNVFLAFTSEEGKLTLELAWSTLTAHGNKMHERVIEITRGSADVVEKLREFRAIVTGKRINVWLVPNFFAAMNPYLADYSAEFEPLHQWCRLRGTHSWCMVNYSIDQEDFDRLTIETLMRRFMLSEESTRKSKRAFLLLRACAMCERDLANRASGRAVAPLELDSERPE